MIERLLWIMYILIPRKRDDGFAWKLLIFYIQDFVSFHVRFRDGKASFLLTKIMVYYLIWWTTRIQIS